MTDEARRYWEAVVAGDLKTANTIADNVVRNLRMQADEAEIQGKYLLPTTLRQKAGQIERGELAPYPKSRSCPMTSTDISKLEPGQHVTDQRGEAWVVMADPWRDPVLPTAHPGAWSVPVERLRDRVFTRIDCRNQWTLSGTKGNDGDD